MGQSRKKVRPASALMFVPWGGLAHARHSNASNPVAKSVLRWEWASARRPILRSPPPLRSHPFGGFDQAEVEQAVGNPNPGARP